MFHPSGVSFCCLWLIDPVFKRSHQGTEPMLRDEMIICGEIHPNQVIGIYYRIVQSFLQPFLVCAALFTPTISLKIQHVIPFWGTQSLSSLMKLQISYTL
jgi:hypothetical protein